MDRNRAERGRGREESFGEPAEHFVNFVCGVDEERSRASRLHPHSTRANMFKNSHTRTAYNARFV